MVVNAKTAMARIEGTYLMRNGDRVEIKDGIGLTDEFLIAYDTEGNAQTINASDDKGKDKQVRIKDFDLVERLTGNVKYSPDGNV